MSINSIPWELYEHPMVAPALETAASIIHGWLDTGLYAGTEEMAAQVVGGWAAADLQQRIAYALMKAGGIDITGLIAEHEGVDREVIAMFEDDVVLRFLPHLIVDNTKSGVVNVRMEEVK